MPWVPVDYRVFLATANFTAVPAGFAAQIQLDAVGGGQLWRVERISVQATFDPAPPPDPIYVYAYDRDPAEAPVPPSDSTVLVNPPALFADLQPSALFDVSDNSEPITVLEANRFTLIFSCATVNQGIAAARIQATIMQGVAGQSQPVAGAQTSPLSPLL